MILMGLSGCRATEVKSSSLAASSQEDSSVVSSSALPSSSDIASSAGPSSNSSAAGGNSSSPADSSSQASSSQEASSAVSSEASSSQASSEAESSSGESSSESSIPAQGTLTVTGGEEYIVLSWTADAKADSYKVLYKLSSASSYTALDSELIDGTKAHILGLKGGTYDVKVQSVEGSKAFDYLGQSSIAVKATDRSGYAFFNNDSGIGAYNADGTLKTGAIVIYVDEASKNTVTCGSYKGLVNILQNQSKIGKPLDIRIKGSIDTNQFNVKNSSAYYDKHTVYDYGGSDYFTNTLETTYASNLSGLTNWVKGPDSLSITTNNQYTYKGVTSSGGTDTYLNMCDVSGQSNITIEGVGSNAVINQWGFTWSKCNSIEVKNLLFQDYPEDACSFQGGGNSDMNYNNFWLHNCTINQGKNNWDCTAEQDKHEGDGGMDLKYLKNVTASYNHFYKDHKTGLIGGSDSAYTQNVTFHHNYYDHCSSRLPLGRRVNLHAYNNYYYECGTCQDMRAYSYTLSENNYFYSCDTVSALKSSAVIKSYNDVFDSCGNNASTIVTLRTADVTNSCKPDGSSDYSDFDTNASLFYYDVDNKVSKVTLMETAAAVKGNLASKAGVFKA